VATSGTGPLGGIDQLGAAMLVAAVVATPVGVSEAAVAFGHPVWLAWAVGVGLCSSVVPYVTDQLAMARLPEATFALMLALLPAAATAIGLLVLAQVPTGRDLLGVALVIAGVAAHQDATVAPVSRGRARDAAGTAPPAARPRPGRA
jgi:inner membrane transporter RhtA